MTKLDSCIESNGSRVRCPDRARMGVPVQRHRREAAALSSREIVAARIHQSSQSVLVARRKGRRSEFPVADGAAIDAVIIQTLLDIG